MKRPIKWHEETLKNSRQSLAAALRHLDEARREYHRLSEYVELRERQIAEARRRGMDAFDSERLLVSRKALADG